VQKITKRSNFVLVKKGQPKRRDAALMELIAERLKELRSERGYSQEFVIERTKLNLPQYEAKHYPPTLDSLAILCKFYNIALDEFFAPMNYPPKENK